MSDLIDRQAAIDTVRHAWAKGLEPSQYIEELPSAQPERKKGEWISNDIDPEAWNFCSVCGEQAIDLFDFCPNCGADMRGEQDG